jgi:hypothetical protein
VGNQEWRKATGKADEQTAAAKSNVLSERTCCGIYMEEKCHTVTGGEKNQEVDRLCFSKTGESRFLSV